MEPDEQPDDDEPVGWWKAVGIGLALFGVIAGSIYWVADNAEERGQWGDFLGGTASMIAMLGVVLTIAMQTLELRLQRRELQLTRKEVAGQRLQLERQVNVLSRELEVKYPSALSLRVGWTFENNVHTTNFYLVNDGVGPAFLESAALVGPDNMTVVPEEYFEDLGLIQVDFDNLTRIDPQHSAPVLRVQTSSDPRELMKTIWGASLDVVQNTGETSIRFVGLTTPDFRRYDASRGRWVDEDEEPTGNR